MGLLSEKSSGSRAHMGQASRSRLLAALCMFAVPACSHTGIVQCPERSLLPVYRRKVFIERTASALVLLHGALWGIAGTGGMAALHLRHRHNQHTQHHSTSPSVSATTGGVGPARVASLGQGAATPLLHAQAAAAGTLAAATAASLLLLNGLMALLPGRLYDDHATAINAVVTGLHAAAQLAQLLAAPPASRSRAMLVRMMTLLGANLLGNEEPWVPFCVELAALLGAAAVLDSALQWGNGANAGHGVGAAAIGRGGIVRAGPATEAALAAAALAGRAAAVVVPSTLVGATAALPHWLQPGAVAAVASGTLNGSGTAAALSVGGALVGVTAAGLAAGGAAATAASTATAAGSAAGSAGASFMPFMCYLAVGAAVLVLYGALRTGKYVTMYRLYRRLYLPAPYAAHITLPVPPAEAALLRLVCQSAPAAAILGADFSGSVASVAVAAPAATAPAGSSAGNANAADSGSTRGYLEGTMFGSSHRRSVSLSNMLTVGRLSTLPAASGSTGPASGSGHLAWAAALTAAAAAAAAARPAATTGTGAQGHSSVAGGGGAETASMPNLGLKRSMHGSGAAFDAACLAAALLTSPMPPADGGPGGQGAEAGIASPFTSLADLSSLHAGEQQHHHQQLMSPLRSSMQLPRAQPPQYRASVGGTPGAPAATTAAFASVAAGALLLPGRNTRSSGSVTQHDARTGPITVPRGSSLTDPAAPVAQPQATAAEIPASPQGGGAGMSLGGGAVAGSPLLAGAGAFDGVDEADFISGKVSFTEMVNQMARVRSRHARVAAVLLLCPQSHLNMWEHCSSDRSVKLTGNGNGLIFEFMLLRLWLRELHQPVCPAPPRPAPPRQIPCQCRCTSSQRRSAAPKRWQLLPPRRQQRPAAAVSPVPLQPTAPLSWQGSWTASCPCSAATAPAAAPTPPHCREPAARPEGAVAAAVAAAALPCHGYRRHAARLTSATCTATAVRQPQPSCRTTRARRRRRRVGCPARRGSGRRARRPAQQVALPLMAPVWPAQSERAAAVVVEKAAAAAAADPSLLPLLRPCLLRSKITASMISNNSSKASSNTSSRVRARMTARRLYRRRRGMAHRAPRRRPAPAARSTSSASAPRPPAPHPTCPPSGSSSSA